MAFKRVLIAVDGEPIGAHAVQVGGELARLADADVAMAYVIDPQQVNAADTAAQPAALEASAHKEAHRLIEELAGQLSLPRPIVAFVQVGSPAAELVRAAEEWPADVIVVGSHGRRGFRRAILGSVAEAVMRQAPCPVLVVRRKE